MTQEKTTAIALFSGGLDSILACRVMMEQGVRVRAVQFVTPFFGYELLAREQEYRLQIKHQYGIEVQVRDLSLQYIQLLRNPPHGFGKHFNPCVDCKILLISEARRLFSELGASFLISGEVIGQRPMSQRRDTLRIIERDSGCEGLLLRPLCAQALKPTQPELDGRVDRERLLNLAGRTRTPQMELAARYGIQDYPSPAGGCVLTDPILAKRIARFYDEQAEFEPDDIRLLLAGRIFRLPQGGLLAMGRNEKENEKITALLRPRDWVLRAADRPGPLAVLRFSEDPSDLKAAAGLVARYSKKTGTREVPIQARSGERVLDFTAFPLPDDQFEAWKR